MGPKAITCCQQPPNNNRHLRVLHRKATQHNAELLCPLAQLLTIGARDVSNVQQRCREAVERGRTAVIEQAGSQSVDVYGSHQSPSCTAAQYVSSVNLPIQDTGMGTLLYLHHSQPIKRVPMKPYARS